MIALGHSLLELIIVILLAIGLSSGMASETIQFTIAILGGVLLSWMGGQMLIGTFRGDIQLPRSGGEDSTMSLKDLVNMGVITTASNPFWYAWWVTAAAGYLVQAQDLGLPAVAAFYFGHISADFTWDTTLSTVVGSGRRWITDRIYRFIIALCGSFFIYTGILFLLMPIRH